MRVSHPNIKVPVDLTIKLDALKAANKKADNLKDLVSNLKSQRSEN